jgi:hypothetical protein
LTFRGTVGAAWSAAAAELGENDMAKQGSAKKRSLRGQKASTGRQQKTSSKPKPPGGKTAAGHIQREDNPWAIVIPDHEPRSDSPAYVVARKVMVGILKEMKESFLGPSEPVEDHHGGGLWVRDDGGWLLIKNLAGMEWSQQFCADPAKVDKLRLYAQRLYKRFPESIPAFRQMGFTDADDVLDQTIDTADKISRWVDSIFNASLPLPQPRHTGTVRLKAKGGTPEVEGGVHHYPTPITDIQLFKRDDFQLWVLDEEKQPAAVLPVGHRGSQQSDVRVAFATPGTDLHKQVAAAAKKGQFVRVDGTHSMAKQAFATQNAADAKSTGKT